ncbi:MAG TPA: Do family serine endopeptidase [Steroidobacteraceae bacterium]|nr:Do family serine endopeptidase [Steroidobacteraceae bacterium]
MQLRNVTVALSASALFACGAAAGGWVIPAFNHSSAVDAAEATQPSSTAPAPVPLGSAPNWRAVVTENKSAVVSITSQSVEHEQGPGDMFGDDSPFGGDDPFSQFFRMLPRQQNVPVRSLGSGFIIRSDGVILTNAHVVRNATHVTVKLLDNREYRAKVVGLDIPTDIAVLKINASHLPTVRLGDSSKLEVGDYVLALGAPYGLVESATAGIVSAKGREIGNSYVPFIQTDVAVNPGNSGGPLFNEHGEVIGINSQIYSNTGGYEGVSFAIPIDVATTESQQILTHGKVEHARLGVSVQPVSQALAGTFKLKQPQGALVSKVEPDSAASRAGIKSGDVILKFDGKPVTDNGTLAALVGSSRPGSSATLDVWRNGKPLTMHVTLGNASQQSGELQASNNGAEHGRLGLDVRPLTPEEKSQAGVPAGLLVQHSTGPAADAGIQPGDIILSADGTPLNSVQELRHIVHDQKNAIALLVQHGDQRIFVPVQLG